MYEQSDRNDPESELRDIRHERVREDINSREKGHGEAGHERVFGITPGNREHRACHRKRKKQKAEMKVLFFEAAGEMADQSHVVRRYRHGMFD